MKSAYPSSQSFFDASSDSIRAIDVEKCRTSSSFTSLSELFAINSNGKSDLFSNVRTPVFVPAEVTFPSRKDRECEDPAAEKVSLWHEWGSGECPGEESSGLLSDIFKPSSSELFTAPSSNLFPNLGSANASTEPEEFSFPERRKREDESWRERRGFRQDWVPNVPTVDNSVRESTAMISSVVDFFAKNPAKPSNLLCSSKPSLFSNLGTPTGSQPEFPARRKREENPFWKDYSSCGDSTPSECTASRTSTSGVNSLSGLYSNSPSSKCSSLFYGLRTSSANSEEVVFPSRKKNPDRNAWRDWCNTGYSDWAQDESEDELSETKDLAPQEEEQVASSETVRSLARPQESAATRREKRDNLGDVSGFVSLESFTKNLARPGLEAGLSSETSRNPSGSCGFRPSLAGEEDEDCQLQDSAVHSRDGERVSARAGRIGLSGTQTQVSKEVNEGEIRFHTEGRYRSSRRDLHEQRIYRQKSQSFPPPLGCLGREGSLRVPHHVPWVQLQPVRSEGRFMLQEVKGTQPVVFEPIREQGRLVLQLIRQDETSEPTERDIQSCQVASGDSNVSVEEAIAGDAYKRLETEEDYASHSDEKSDTATMEVVKEKVRKASKWPKVYPEGCLPLQLEVSETMSKQIVEKEPDSNPMEQTVGESRQSVKKTRKVAAANYVKDGSSGCSRDPLPDPGLEDSYATQNASAFTSENVVDVGGTQEIPALLPREIEAPSQSLPFWNFPMKWREGEYQPTYKVLSRSCKARNAVPGGSGLPVLPTLHRTRSIRNIALNEFSRAEGEKDGASKDRWRGREEGCFEPCPSFLVSSVQGFDGLVGLHASNHFLQWSLRKIPEAPGDPDGRLTNYQPVAASFLCADGVGKRHHEKSFWEQPCVS